MVIEVDLSLQKAFPQVKPQRHNPRTIWCLDRADPDSVNAALDQADWELGRHMQCCKHRRRMGIVAVYLSVNRKPLHPTQVRCKADTKKPSRHARNLTGYQAEKVRIPPIQDQANTRIQTIVCDSAEES